MNQNEPISPNNAPHPAINPYQTAVPVPAPGYTVRYADSTASTTPPRLKGFYNNETFKVIAFFVLTCGILSTSTVAFYHSRLSSDKYIGIISSLLMMSLPSPLQTMKKQKKQPIIIQQQNSPV